jgi:hypothetical protein
LLQQRSSLDRLFHVLTHRYSETSFAIQQVLGAHSNQFAGTDKPKLSASACDHVDVGYSCQSGTVEQTALVEHAQLQAKAIRWHNGSQ